jgi:hypothetical protein
MDSVVGILLTVPTLSDACSRAKVQPAFHPMDFLNALGKILGKNDFFSVPALVIFRRRCRRID